jgi:hypothetical protein
MLTTVYLATNRALDGPPEDWTSYGTTIRTPSAARRLREMAQHWTPLSDQLRVMAAELEPCAEELQRDQQRQSRDG